MDTPGEDGSVDKLPGARSETWMAVLSMALLVLGFAIGIVLLAWQGASDVVIVFTARKTLKILFGTTLITLLTLVAHEALHGLGMVLLGARPRFGAGVMAPGMPYLYTTSEGHLFTRWQYIAIAAAPNVLINLGLLVAIWWGPHAAWWVAPFAIHMSGGLGDAWLCWSCLVERRGTLIEDRRDGLRVHRAG